MQNLEMGEATGVGDLEERSDMTTFQSRTHEQERHHPPDSNNEMEDTFVSATDLSSVLNSSQLSTSSGDSHNSSSSFQYTSSGSGAEYSGSVSSNSMSASVYSTSGSEKGVGGSELDKSQDLTSSTGTTVSSIVEMTLAADLVSSSSSTTSTAVRRCESWSALRSSSVESNKSSGSGGSERDNSISSGEFKSVATSVKEQLHNETYHTPSASLYSITISQHKSSPDFRREVPEIEEKPEENAKVSFSLEDEGKDSETISPINESKADDTSVDTQEFVTASSESNTSKEGSSICTGPSPPVLAISGKQVTKVEKRTARKAGKKKMWYQQIFGASYKSRSGDFKKLFKELPKKERLLVDYSCALQKEILVQGRMYISQGHLSFHANIFGWETQTSIRLKDISSITKEKTALVIPNAIQVITGSGEKFFFTSFVTRDATYLMLFKLWQSALLETSMPSKEIRRLIQLSYGEELAITSDDETVECLSSPSSPVTGEIQGLSSPDENKSIHIDSQAHSGDIAPAIIVSGKVSSFIGAPKVPGDSKNGLGLPIVPAEPSDLSESSDSDEEFQIAEGILDEDFISEVPACPTGHLEGKEILNTVFPCNIDQLFTMMFTNSKFILDLHTARKTFNINLADWEYGKDGKQQRQISMTVSLSAVMGPKHAHVTETQIMDSVSKPGFLYVINSENVNAGVPYADTFSIIMHYCLSRVSTTESRMVVMSQIKYKKNVWGITKSIIEKNTIAGLEDFYAHLEKALRDECTKMMVGSSPIPSPKHAMNGAVRRRHIRTKRRAPDIPVGVAPAPRNMRIGGLSADTASVTMSDMIVTDTPLVEGSLVLKIILSVLAGLLLLNAFLYFKLSHLESSASPQLFSNQPLTFIGEMPQNHQEWLQLLQKQEALHRIELEKWHEILISALKILHHAESDLEVLKHHITTYSEGKVMWK